MIRDKKGKFCKLEDAETNQFEELKNETVRQNKLLTRIIIGVLTVLGALIEVLRQLNN